MRAPTPPSSASPFASPWRDGADRVEVAFFGRGFDDPRAALAAIGEPGLDVASLRQVHSATVLEADPPRRCEADGLVSSRPRLALLVVTADCVPLLLGGGDRVAALHAGWRGLAAGIVERGVAALGTPAAQQTAWVGPAIGRCCYEVSLEVAQAVAQQAVEQLTVRGPRGRPLLDLAAAAGDRLRRSGVREVRVVDACTRCSETLHSYRRDGSGSGRNLSFAWLRPRPGS